MKASVYSLGVVLILVVSLFSFETKDEATSKKLNPTSLPNKFLDRAPRNSVMFKGDEGGFISSETTHDMINNYLIREAEKGNSHPTQAIFFGKEKLLKMLEKSDVAGLTFYVGMKEGEKEKLSLIIVSSDENWNDIVNHKGALKSNSIINDDYLDQGNQCCPISK